MVDLVSVLSAVLPALEVYVLEGEVVLDLYPLPPSGLQLTSLSSTVQQGDLNIYLYYLPLVYLKIIVAHPVQFFSDAS